MTTERTTNTKLLRAQELHEKFVNMRVAFRAQWAIYGLWAKEFRDDQLFKLLGHGSMKAYLKSLPDVCYSTIAEAMAVIDAFPDMATAQIAEYPKENLKILAKLTQSQRRSPTLRQKAKELKAKDLRAFVNRKMKVHLERKIRIVVDVDESAGEQIIEAALEKMQDEIEDETGEETSRGTALEMICASYLLDGKFAVRKVVKRGQGSHSRNATRRA